MLFERGANAVQVQRWLGHHSAAFTLATYVHLLDGNLGDALDLSLELSDERPVSWPRKPHLVRSLYARF